jgi:hypothetical protein
MSRRIRITAVAKKEPDVRLYVLALLALAQQLQEAERSATPPTVGPHETEETK